MGTEAAFGGPWDVRGYTSPFGGGYIPPYPAGGYPPYATPTDFIGGADVDPAVTDPVQLEIVLRNILAAQDKILDRIEALDELTGIAGFSPNDEHPGYGLYQAVGDLASIWLEGFDAANEATDFPDVPESSCGDPECCPPDWPDGEWKYNVDGDLVWVSAEEPYVRPGTEFFSQHHNDDDGNPAGGESWGVGIDIEWQNGPLGRGADRQEPNGAFVETVLKIAADRIEYYQDSRFNSTENAMALSHIKEAIEWLNRRTANREDRGVEGTHQQ